MFFVILYIYMYICKNGYFYKKEKRYFYHNKVKKIGEGLSF